MNILVVHGQKLENYPPVRSLVDVLTRNGHKVTLITKYDTEPLVQVSENLKLLSIPDNKNTKSISNVFSYVKKKRTMRKLVEIEMKENDVLWTTTDSTIRDLGNVVLKYKHIMQLMELIEDMPKFPGISIPKLHIDKYARNALKVVVPEYNRAHIQKVWWGLNEVPTIFPNKMSSIDLENPSEEIKEILENIQRETRKIVLYQGTFSADRNLETFAKAIESVNNEYVLYVMGSDSNDRKELCEKFPSIEYIPFIAPPYHLLVSQYAYIGLLPYVPKKIGFNSILNALYCAPNKIFEFSGLGIPMIGSDVPGLGIPFVSNDIGRICKTGTEEEILLLIDDITKEYKTISENCKKYYDSFDLDRIINDILKSI